MKRHCASLRGRAEHERSLVSIGTAEPGATRRAVSPRARAAPGRARSAMASGTATRRRCAATAPTRSRAVTRIVATRSPAPSMRIARPTSPTVATSRPRAARGATAISPVRESGASRLGPGVGGHTAGPAAHRAGGLGAVGHGAVASRTRHPAVRIALAVDVTARATLALHVAWLARIARDPAALAGRAHDVAELPGGTADVARRTVGAHAAVPRARGVGARREGEREGEEGRGDEKTGFHVSSMQRHSRAADITATSRRGRAWWCTSLSAGHC